MIPGSRLLAPEGLKSSSSMCNSAWGLISARPSGEVDGAPVGVCGMNPLLMAPADNFEDSIVAENGT